MPSEARPHLGPFDESAKPIIKEFDLMIRIKKGVAETNMRPEELVVQAAVRYFTTHKFARFSKEEEYSIQIGSYRERADIALIDMDGELAAIIECKKVGYEGSGADPLKSYLSATDTPLGVFVNETDPGGWVFYENQGQNQFKQIDRSQFEGRVLKSGVMKKLEKIVRCIFRRRRKVAPPRPDPGIIPMPPNDSPIIWQDP